ncbi:MAG: hypothetical protein ACD_60C00149G0031 [uncultured bacterium]|nr:MAG: hypothetical protein ACD_60C00149G0031 [uncultured bacterium]
MDSRNNPVALNALRQNESLTVPVLDEDQKIDTSDAKSDTSLEDFMELTINQATQDVTMRRLPLELPKEIEMTQFPLPETKKDTSLVIPPMNAVGAQEARVNITPPAEDNKKTISCLEQLKAAFNNCLGRKSKIG